MFRISTILTSVFVVLSAFFWLSYLTKKPDLPKFSKKQDTRNSMSCVEQVREKVRKDIWLVESPGQRLHHRIESDRSLISFNSKKSSIEILEHLFGVRCWIQEKNASIKDPSQQLRFVLAEEGFYQYKNQDFWAQDVLLSMYKIPKNTEFGALESYTPFLQGNAESINFSLKNGSPRFIASRFKASIGDASR